MNNPHIHPGLLPAALLLMLAAGAATAQDSPLIAERPGQFLIPTPVGQGELIIESGISLRSDEFIAGGSRVLVSALRAPSAMIRFGALRSMELQVSGDYLRERTTIARSGGGSQIRQGANAIGLGMKVAIRDEEGGAPAIGLLAGVGLPLGDAGFGPRSVSSSLTFGMRSTLGEDMALYYSLGAGWSGSHPAPIESYAVGLVQDLTPELKGFVELYGSTASGMAPSHSFDAGFAVLVTPRFQLDFFGGRGLSRSAPEYVISLGMALRVTGP